MTTCGKTSSVLKASQSEIFPIFHPSLILDDQLIVHYCRRITSDFRERGKLALVALYHEFKVGFMLNWFQADWLFALPRLPECVLNIRGCLGVSSVSVAAWVCPQCPRLPGYTMSSVCEAAWVCPLFPISMAIVWNFEIPTSRGITPA